MCIRDSSHADRIILGIAIIKNTESYIYLYRNQDGLLGLDILKNKSDGDARFWKVDREFYQYANNSSGIQRVFRIFDNKIVPLLSNLRTGAGLSGSKNHAVFYHITGSKEITRTNTSGQQSSQRVYNFRLHLIHRNIKEIQSLKNLTVEDYNYRLKINWARFIDNAKGFGNKLEQNYT